MGMTSATHYPVKFYENELKSPMKTEAVWSNGILRETKWFNENGKLHNAEGPAFLSYNNRGDLKFAEWHIEGERRVYIEKWASRNGVKGKAIHHIKNETKKEQIKAFINNSEGWYQANKKHLLGKSFKYWPEWLKQEFRTKFVDETIDKKEKQKFYLTGEYYDNGHIMKLTGQTIENDPSEGETFGIIWFENGQVEMKTFHFDDEPHRIGGPAIIVYDETGKIESEEYYQNGERHREDGPALIWYNNDEMIEKSEWWKRGEKIE
ncbi:MAG: hypothetical protein WCO00_10820 [Rhodospirillaceae bacterium]